MHSKYCDRVYSWNHDFSCDNRIKVFIIGNSYARDWANILAESDIIDSIEISYVYFSGGNKSDLEKYSRRIDDADIIFFVLSNFTGGSNKVPQCVLESCSNEKLWIVGNKYFGVSNGIVYRNRFSKDWFQYAVNINKSFLIDNQNQKRIYKDHYIDLFQPVLTEDCRIKVFTPEGKFISQDCRHLTQNGARFYAKKFDFSWILSINRANKSITTTNTEIKEL